MTLTDPNAMNYLISQLIEQDKVSLLHSSRELIEAYEILLSLSIIFGADSKSCISEMMLQTCVDIMQLVQEHLSEIEAND